MKILLCPDSFKGSISATKAASAMAKGCKRTWPKATIKAVPLGDGGEGTAEILAQHWAYKPLQLLLEQDSLTIEVQAFQDANKKHAVLDVAEMLGLPLMQKHGLNPAKHQSQVLGKCLLLLKKQGFSKITLCLGGTGIADMGIGLAQVLGWQFLDNDGQNVSPDLLNLQEIQQCRAPETLALGEMQIEALCDVPVPWLGKQGGLRLFGPQKGLTAEDIDVMESGFARVINLLQAEHNTVLSSLSGTGAAGGLGLGLLVFANASLQEGANVVARETGLASHIKAADIVLTGEGKIDKQSTKGKVLHKVIALCQKHQKPCFAIGGSIEDEHTTAELGLSGAIQLYGPEVSLEEAMQHPAFHIEDCARTLTDYLQHNA